MFHVCSTNALQFDACVQNLDLSQNSLSGRAPAYLLKRTSTGTPFEMLARVNLFRQWGSQLCAHLSTADLCELRRLEDFPGDHLTRDLTFNCGSAEGSNDVFSNPGPSACHDLSVSEIAESAASFAHVGPKTLLETPPTFSWLPQGSSELFIGLCDLPEMLKFKCDLIHHTSSLSALILCSSRECNAMSAGMRCI